MTGKNIPSILAQSQEFSLMKVRNAGEFEVLMNIKKNDLVKEAIPKHSEKKAPI